MLINHLIIFSIFLHIILYLEYNYNQDIIILLLFIDRFIGFTEIFEIMGNCNSYLIYLIYLFKFVFHG